MRPFNIPFLHGIFKALRKKSEKRKYERRKSDVEMSEVKMSDACISPNGQKVRLIIININLSYPEKFRVFDEWSSL